MKSHSILLIFITIITLLLANTPFLAGIYHTTSSEVFLGRHTINSEDTYTYISFIEQAKQGRSLFENLYTTEPQTPTLFRPSYLVIGIIAQVLNLNSILAYHLARIVLSCIFFIVLARFLKLFFTSPLHHAIAFTFVALSTGLPTLTWIPESTTFYTLAEAPHFVLSLILTLLGMHALIRRPLLAPIFFFLLCFEHPFNLVVLLPTILVCLLWAKVPLQKALLLVGLSGLGLAYQLFELTHNPILKAWSNQNALLSPSPMTYILGFGLLLPLACLGAEIYLKNTSLKYKLILCWVAITALAIYFPLSFQRRLIEGVHIPLSILAAAGFIELLARHKTRRALILAMSTVTLLIGTFSFIQMDSNSIKNATYRSYYFLPQTEMTAFSWLKTHTEPTAVIFANKDYGNLIPGLTGRKTFIGHRIQTQNEVTKIQIANTFLKEKSPVVARIFLDLYHIKYIYLGPNDAMLQYGFTPEILPFLEVIYTKDGITIYRVK